MGSISQFKSNLPPYISQNGIELLNLRRLPARLDVRQVACVLGFAEHDVPVLVKAKLLSPLGNPKPNSPKYYWAVEIEQLTRDRKWLDRATKVIADHWYAKRVQSEQVAAVN